MLISSEPSNATPLIVTGVVSFPADATTFPASGVLSTLSNPRSSLLKTISNTFVFPAFAVIVFPISEES
jgi:hypothetical protein